MKQTFDPLHDLKEGAVLLGLGDLPFDDRTDGHRLHEPFPRVLLQLPQGEGDARLLGVELDHLHGDLFPQLQDVCHLGHAIPRQLRDVNQSIGSADVHERSIAGDARDRPLDRSPGLEPAEELFPLARAILVLGSLLADDEPVALSVDLENLHGDPLADQRLQAARVSARDLARGQEASQAEDVDDQAALVLLANVGVDNRPVRLLLSGDDPRRLRPRPAQAEDHVSFFVLRLEDIDLDLVARLEPDRVHVTTVAELLARDDPFGLRPDIDQHLVRVDSHHDSIDDVPVVRGLEGLLVVMEVVLHRHRVS